MSRKQVLAPSQIASNQSLAASFNSIPTVIDFQDNVSYQINIATTDSTGSFAVQVSLDYQPATANVAGNAGNWANLTMSGVPTVAAANDTIIINLNQLPYRAVRLAYTSTVAGTGTCNIYIMAKTVGA